MTPRTENIDALLTHLESNTLARDLVSLLRDLQPDRWDPALRELLLARVAEEVNRVRNAENQPD
jgi:hypothetical protein